MTKAFQGVYAVLCTPFTPDDKVDEAALRKHVRYLIDEGKIHGVIPNGSTGEFTALSEAVNLWAMTLTAASRPVSR